MLKLRPRHRLKVPSGLAIVGALLLLVSTLTGMNSTLGTPRGESAAVATFVSGADADTAESSPDSGESMPQAPVQKKRFKMNLFLFRR